MRNVGSALLLLEVGLHNLNLIKSGGALRKRRAPCLGGGRSSRTPSTL